VDPAVQRARVLLLGLFGLVGIMFSGWLARIPSVRDALGMSPAELGGILIAGSVGSLATVSVAGVLVNRYGGRAVLYVSTGAFAAAYVLIGLGPTTGSAPVLALGIFLSGVGFALGNVPLNVETAAVERRMGRTVLPQFHAAFSIGAVVGSGIGALCAAADVPLLVQFTATAVVGTVWRLLSVPGAVIESLPPDRAALVAARDARAEGRSPREAGLAGRLRAARVRRVARLPRVGHGATGRSAIPAASSAARTARATGTAPGVSECTHSDSAATGTSPPSTLATTPSRTIRTARAPASPGSVTRAPGSPRGTSVPSAR